MKKVMFIILLASSSVCLADYWYSRNTVAPIGDVRPVNSVEAQRAYDQGYHDARLNRTYPRTTVYPRYSTVQVREVTPVRAAAEDVVTGAEAIIEAPLNLIP